MGYLYIKVIESKKVAVRSSFFVNYPFIRLRIGKEKKDTNFKPGVEWWDKIYNFKDVSPSSHLNLIAQARDKSIHVFGSDWLGEASIHLEDLMDGNVHQKWFKLGRGNKNHTRSPRGYLHLAFQYFDSHPSGKRPFSAPPVEPVMAFEDWLVANGDHKDSFFSSSTPAINPSASASGAERLRKSAPATERASFESPSPKKKKAPLSTKSKSTNSLGMRARANTVPDSRKAAESDSEESDSSYEESEPVSVPTANLIDLSIFDEPTKKSDVKSSSTGIDIFNKESPVRFSPKSVPAHQTTTNAPMTAPADILEKLNSDPAFDAWYHAPKDAHVSFNPKNPFLAMNEQSPAFVVQK